MLRKTIIDTDNADDIALLVRAKYLQQSPEQAVGGISLHVDANKTEYTCFKREGISFTLSGEDLKLLYN